MVRLRNYNGAIIDGEFYKASNENIARDMYLERCKRLGIEIAQYDYITIEEFEL